MADQKSNPINSFLQGLLNSCLELTSANAKMNETDPLISWFQERIYVETPIDIFLPDDIVAMKYDLILMSGTPGSGKTQFIKSLKRILQQKGFSLSKDIERLQEYRKDDNVFIVKHDATQVESEADDAVQKLGELISAEWNDDNFDKVPKTNKYLIGINKGVLQKLYTLPDFRKLTKAIKIKDNKNILEIDLASRSVVFPHQRKDSFITQLMHEICNREFWEETPNIDSQFDYQTCHNCQLCQLSICPILNNVRELRKQPTLDRLNELFELSHFIAGHIITFRDVLAILSKVIAGYHSYYDKYNTPCDAIRAQVSEGGSGNYLNLYRLTFINAVFTDQDIWREWLNNPDNNNLFKGYSANLFSGYSGPYFHVDSLEVGMMSKFDVMNSSVQSLRKLDDTVFNDFRGYINAASPKNDLEKKVFSAMETQLLEYEKTDIEKENVDRDHRYREWMLLAAIRIARRREAFWGSESILSLNNYYYAESFFDTVQKIYRNDTDDLYALGGDLVLGISSLSGSRSDNELKINLSSIEKEVKAEIVLNAYGKLTAPKDQNADEYKYVEYYPKYINFQLINSDDEVLLSSELSLDLDEWECLMRLANGHIKDFVGMQTSHVLDGFIEGIRAKSWLQRGVTLLISDDKNTLQIKRSGDKVKLQ